MTDFCKQEEEYQIINTGFLLLLPAKFELTQAEAAIRRVPSFLSRVDVAED